MGWTLFQQTGGDTLIADGVSADRDRRAITIHVCTRNPGHLEAEATFCVQLYHLHTTLTMAKMEKAKIMAQMDADEGVKKQLTNDIEEAKKLLNREESELDMIAQQVKSDEMTRDFLLQQFADIKTQLVQEQQQTVQLEKEMEKYKVKPHRPYMHFNTTALVTFINYCVRYAIFVKC